MPSILKSIHRGVELLESGKPGKAADLYRDVLLRSPNHADALHLLAVAVFQLGDAKAAREYARRALEANPNAADYHSNFGRYSLSLGRAAEAVRSCERALQLQPSHAMARFNLAGALAAVGRHAEAITHLERYVELQPDTANGHLALGNLLAEAQRHGEALACFARALALQPQLPEAENNLGNALQALGRHEESLPHYEAALRLRSPYPDALSNKGAALQALGRLEEARLCHEEALRQNPDLIHARGNMGNLLSALGHREEAVAIYRQILDRVPESVETWNNLGNSLQELGRYPEAMQAYQEALKRRPEYYLVHNNIGNTLRRQGRYLEAIASYKTALAADPNFVEAMNNLGVALQDMGQLTQAAPWFEKARTVRPEYVDALINLANNCRDRGYPEQAIAHLRRALEKAPSNPHIWNNIGCALGDQGQITEALGCYRRTMELTPANDHAHSNLLLNLHYTGDYSPEQIYEAHREFARLHEGRLAHLIRPPTNTADPDRRLRIGYVSADFRRHSVAYFLEPVLERHNRDQIEVVCYADVTRPDAVTEQLRGLVGNGWRDIRGYSAESFAAEVRADAVDILIDLGGHTANSRLLDFSARPAPVQVTWLGYPDTTGLDSIDYRLTDGWADPAGTTEAWHSEELIRLASGFLCFRPPPTAPDVAPVPSLAGQPFTFGSFNSMAKMSGKIIELWAEILRRVPGSRLAIKNKALSEKEARQRLVEVFASHGIPQHRLYMAGLLESLHDHLDAYRVVDLALDSWPYHGTTTTCEALWMGVPVITLLGRSHVSRVGLSVLDAAGLAELAASSPQEYIDKAVTFAANAGELAELRATLRERVNNSRLRDERGFTAALEAAYRQMWHRWCEHQRP